MMTILDAMEDGVYIVTGDFTLEFMNQSMIREFGEGVGRKCYEAQVNPSGDPRSLGGAFSAQRLANGSC